MTFNLWHSSKFVSLHYVLSEEDAVEPCTALCQVCKSLRFSGVSVPRDYEQGFQRALWTFQHQRVWCPDRRQLVHLRPLPQGGLSAGASCSGTCSGFMLDSAKIRRTKKQGPDTLT